jgi:NADPH:quinone reductase
MASTSCTGNLAAVGELPDQCFQFYAEKEGWQVLHICSGRSHMKAALCKSLDGPDAIVIEEIPDPLPDTNQVVVRVKAAALNFLDTLMTRGKYQHRPELPFSPASEFAGTVEKIGSSVRTFKPGDRVCGYGGSGAAREKILATPDTLVRVPDAVRDEIAAGVSVTYGTASHAFKDRAALNSGETVAVLGASGGAGLAAVEIAKLMGARVIAVASSAEKLEICRQHGADAVFNYAVADLKLGLRELTSGNGVDVVYDCVGGPYTEAALRSIAWGGRLLVIGFAAGEIPRIPINLLLLKSCSLVGVFWGEHTRRVPSAHRANLEQVLNWVAEGRLRPHVHATYPLDRTADAIRELDGRKATGKVVIVI